MMCWYFCIGFINFKLKEKNSLRYTKLFCPNEYKKNNEITFFWVESKLKWWKFIVIIAIKIENLKTLKYIFLKKY